jgi:hypothetical protein
MVGGRAEDLPDWLSDERWVSDIEQEQGVDALGAYQDFRLSRAAAGRWAPDGDTMGIAQALSLDPDARERDLEKEIFIALLLSPVRFDFPSMGEWAAAVRVRRRIVQAARRTVLAFDTEQAERPDCWRWSEDTGFILQPGHELIPSLELTLWPDLSGRLFSFSCYRATEYVLLLALAQELAESHPAALASLQLQWRTRAIQSGAFHDVFLKEYGSLQAPLPPRYYVPGDRLWFRNPDEASAEVEGYEGSWVFYLGSGRFTNFWKPGQPYTLVSKCLELYHWRDGLRSDGGRAWIDESLVEARVVASLADPAATRRILERMMRLRDPGGVYAEGGCIDASREALRCLLPETWDLGLPNQVPAV